MNSKQMWGSWATIPYTLTVVVNGTPARSSDPMFIVIVAVIASVELSEDAEELERRAEPIV